MWLHTDLRFSMHLNAFLGYLKHFHCTLLDKIQPQQSWRWKRMLFKNTLQTLSLPVRILEIVVSLFLTGEEWKYFCLASLSSFTGLPPFPSLQDFLLTSDRELQLKFFKITCFHTRWLQEVELHIFVPKDMRFFKQFEYFWSLQSLKGNQEDRLFQANCR